MIGDIEALFAQYEDLRTYLVGQGQPSYASTIESIAPKVLLLAAASYFESQVVSAIVDHFTSRLGRDDPRVEFVKERALERQYHSLFDWKATNVNKLWAFFGPTFKEYAARAVDDDDVLSDGVRAFLEIGRVRNEMVHGNYLSYDLQKTGGDIMDLARRGDSFISRLGPLMAGYIPSTPIDPDSGDA